ncbi:hypothetical protein EniLVp02_0250 [Vibrio phage EniLVp02]
MRQDAKHIQNEFAGNGIQLTDGQAAIMAEIAQYVMGTIRDAGLAQEFVMLPRESQMEILDRGVKKYFRIAQEFHDRFMTDEKFREEFSKEVYDAIKRKHG